MNLFQIFDSIAQVDDSFYDRVDTRRSYFKHLLSGSKKVSMAAAPLFLGTLFNKAYAGTAGVQESVLEVLKYAYRLEQLEKNFYDQALNGSNGLSATIKNDMGLREILANETSHVTLLAGAIGSVNLPAADNYNFTKVYRDVFTNDATFLAVAQALEDTGVRAYKGRAAELMADPATLEIALNIHSVEARHAAHVRRMRGQNAWVTGEASTIPDVAIPGTTSAIPGTIFYQAGNPAANFPSEANATQAGKSNYAGSGIAADRYSEAFDEPLDKDTVLNRVAQAFLV